MTSFKEQAEEYVSAIMQRLRQETAISGFCLDQELFILPTGNTLEWQMFVLTNSGKTYIDKSISDQQLYWLAEYAYDIDLLEVEQLPSGYTYAHGEIEFEPEDADLEEIAYKLAHLAA